MKIKLHLLGAIIVLAGLLTLSGVASTEPGQEFREEFHQTYPLSANGRVSLENINGNVKVAVWDRNEIQVDAVKTARREERLAEAKIDIQADADSIAIKTRYPSRTTNWDSDDERRYNNPASVEYTLTVPRTARINKIDLINGGLDIEGVAGEVRANLINGRLRARQLTGEVHLTTINGRMEVTFEQVNDAQRVSLESVNGSVILSIPSEIGATLKASTVHGDIDNSFGLAVEKGRHVGRNLSGVLGDGRARINLSNVNGNIEIRR
jgi:DUF4097 and DUF4098 domain-containing protein YvlB